MHEARICRLLLPRSVDGDEIEPWVYLRVLQEISRHDGSVGWNVFVANSAALIAPFLPPDPGATELSDPACRRRLGAAKRLQSAGGPGRLSRHGPMAICLGLPAGDLDGRALPGAGAGWLAALERRRQTHRAHAAVPGRTGDPDRWLMGSDRHAGHHVRRLSA